MFDVVVQFFDHDTFKLNDFECVIKNEFNHVRIESRQKLVEDLVFFNYFHKKMKLKSSLIVLLCSSTFTKTFFKIKISF